MNIVLSAVSKIYGLPKAESSVTALDHVDRVFPQGCFCAITGPSGCGKTTLLRIIGCQDEPTSGEVLLDGISASTYGDARLAKIRNEIIGFVPQDFGLIGSLTVVENLCIPVLFSKKISYREGKQRAAACLAVVGLSGYQSRIASRLSGGQRQRVAVARAMLMNPEVILADEPTGSLHSALAAGTLSIFDDLHKQGKTIIVVTHNLNVAMLCSVQYEMQDGRFATSV